jgi:hypothetical protein
VSRFLVGITISGAHNSVTLMTEYVPKYYRGIDIKKEFKTISKQTEGMGDNLE